MSFEECVWIRFEYQLKYNWIEKQIIKHCIVYLHNRSIIDLIFIKYNDTKSIMKSFKYVGILQLIRIVL